MMTRNYLRRRPAKLRNSVPRAKAPGPKVQYALRAADGKFWDGRTRRQHSYGKLYAWTPRYSLEPTYWTNLKTALTKLGKYDLERDCGENIPTVELVEFELKAIETRVIDTQVNFVPNVTARIQRTQALDFAMAFQRLCESVKGDVEQIKEYKYALRRTRSKAKDLISEHFPSSFSYGFYTILKTEADIVMARMVLGASLVEHFEMDIFYDFDKPFDPNYFILR